MFITQPTVHVVGQSKFDREAVKRWAHDHGIGDLLGGGTPLASLVEYNPESDDGEALIEFAGRQCYRAFRKGRPSDEYLRNLIDEGHTSVLEHATINFAFSGVSRSLSHELVRHRAGVAISQESQRYVDAKDMKFVVPPLVLSLEKMDAVEPRKQFEADCLEELQKYVKFQETLRDGIWDADKEGTLTADDIKKDTALKKRINEAARALLPNASETRLVWTANYRTLRHFLDMRGQQGADLEIRRLACELFIECNAAAPNIFADFSATPGDFGVPVISR